MTHDCVNFFASSEHTVRKEDRRESIHAEDYSALRAEQHLTQQAIEHCRASDQATKH